MRPFWEALYCAISYLVRRGWAAEQIPRQYLRIQIVVLFVLLSHAFALECQKPLSNVPQEAGRPLVDPCWLNTRSKSIG
jgi:hypothetical protein